MRPWALCKWPDTSLTQKTMKKTLYLLLIILCCSTVADAQCGEPDADVWLNTWTSCNKAAHPVVGEYPDTHWIMYNFGSVRRLSKTWVWNTNDPNRLNEGFKDVSIDYSVNGTDWEYWGDMVFPQGEGVPVYGGFPGPDMVDVEAQYVVITARSTYGTGACAGLAEVKFNLLPQIDGAGDDDDDDETVTAIPEAMESKVTVYPNPADQMVTVALQDITPQGMLYMSVRSVDGRLLYEDEFRAGANWSTELELDAVDEGLYIMTLAADNFHEAKSILVIR